MLDLINRFVDDLEERWHRRRFRHLRAASLVVVLVGGVCLIEAARLTPEFGWPDWTKRVHLAAISWSIGLLLIFELVEMAFAISRSVATSVARYLQLYALVLIRDAFLKLEVFPEPIEVFDEQLEYVFIMGSDAAGGILLFLAAAIFARMQRHTPITDMLRGRKLFGAIKRVLVLLLLVSLAGLCAWRVLSFFGIGDAPPVLDTYFTVLVFVDILLAFVSLALTSNPAIVFRNFGFAFCAILLRLSVAAEVYIRPCLGVAAGITAIAITAAYNFAIETGDAPGSPAIEDVKDPPEPS